VTTWDQRHCRLKTTARMFYWTWMWYGRTAKILHFDRYYCLLWCDLCQRTLEWVADWFKGEGHETIKSSN